MDEHDDHLDGGAGSGPTCVRFHRDGTRCTNRTTNADRWCREPECGGFLHQDIRTAPEDARHPPGWRRLLSQTKGASLDLDVDEVADLSVTNRAADSFRFRHGGSAEAARVQLRAMLEDFLLHSVHLSSPDGYLTLSRQGYHLVVSPDREAIVGYSTVHRERTWEQVKAGVRSRFRGSRGASSATPSPGQEAGRGLEPAEVLDRFDAETAYLTARVRQSYAHLFALQHASDEELDGHIRAAARGIRQGVLDLTRELPGIAVVADGLRWVISPDGLLLIGVKRDAAAASPDPGSAAGPGTGGSND